MYLARILYPVKVLGPGNRIGIWFDGCTHGCKGCSNPELWDFQERYNISIDNVTRLIKSIADKQPVDGFTITGGDPFEQADDLDVLLGLIAEISSDIIVYTGYDYELLKATYPSVLKKIAVLIDGKYVEEKNNNCFMRGSSNQNIIVLNSDYQELYDEYLRDGENQIQNFTSNDGVISVGIHRSGYNDELNNLMEKMGLEAEENG